MENNIDNIINPNLEYEITGSERTLNVLLKEVHELKNKVFELQTKKIIDETQLPVELLSQNGLLPVKPLKLKRGKGYRPLLKSEIEDVQKQTPFVAAQARLLNVSYSTIRKYSELYGIFNPKPNEKGKRNLFDANRGKYHLKDILDGKYPDISDWTVKDKLVRSGTFPACCNICGYDKRRITDKKICLLVDHKDGNRKNFSLENLQLLCLNCTFECGRGYIRRGKHTVDADWIQGAEWDNIDKISRW